MQVFIWYSMSKAVTNKKYSEYKLLIFFQYYWATCGLIEGLMNIELVFIAYVIYTFVLSKIKMLILSFGRGDDSIPLLPNTNYYFSRFIKVLVKNYIALDWKSKKIIYTERKTDLKSRYFAMFESTFAKCLIQLSIWGRFFFQCKFCK